MARESLKTANTILVKIGTDVVNASDGFLAMGRVGSIIEQVRSLISLKTAHSQVVD